MYLSFIYKTANKIKHNCIILSVTYIDIGNYMILNLSVEDGAKNGPPRQKMF